MGICQPEDACQPTNIVNCFYPLEGEPSKRLATVRDRLVGCSPPPAALSPVIKLGYMPANKKL